MYEASMQSVTLNNPIGAIHNAAGMYLLYYHRDSQYSYIPILTLYQSYGGHAFTLTHRAVYTQSLCRVMETVCVPIIRSDSL